MAASQISGAVIVPHPPVIIPTVGRAREYLTYVCDGNR